MEENYYGWLHDVVFDVSACYEELGASSWSECWRWKVEGAWASLLQRGFGEELGEGKGVGEDKELGEEISGMVGGELMGVEYLVLD